MTELIIYGRDNDGSGKKELISCGYFHGRRVGSFAGLVKVSDLSFRRRTSSILYDGSSSKD